ncbi:MAG: LTA synthase family protein, partial [Clostridia bacterium]|nr:LTA synthase family protein [Clostridia bacterium]
TTIIITGDHPTMDAGYIQRNIPEEYDRKVYNCFINSLANTENIKNRDFCSLDMFPTILASIGCEIEGDRLGLGTNLFSSTPTLCESMGYDKFDEELDKKSDYYDSVFMGLDF